jgi:hypothetical protein
VFSLHNRRVPVSFYVLGAAVTSTLVRLVGIIASVLIATDGLIGAMCNDLVVPEASKNSSVMLHFHGVLAWLCFAGMTIFAVGIFRFLGPPFGDDTLDFEDRRRRSVPLVAIGLGLFIALQGFVDS